MSARQVSSGAARSTQEQLRVDHIENLELLRRYKLENARLKKELRGTKGTSEVDVNETISEVETATVSADVLDLAEQNTKQAEEIKLLKTRMNQTDIELMKLRQSVSSAQQAGAYAAGELLKKKESEMASALFELETSLRSAKAELGTLASWKDRCKELEQKHAELAAEYENAQQQWNSKSADDSQIMGEYQKTCEEVQRLQRENLECRKVNESMQARLDAQDADYREQVAALSAKNALLSTEAQLHAEYVRSLEQTNAKLIKECSTQKGTIQALHATIDALRMAAVTAALEGATTTAASISSEADTRQGATSTTVTPAAESTATAAGESDTDSSARFQEFMRLKRENKELKMRLADMAQGGGAGGGNSGRSAGSGDSGGMGKAMDREVQQGASTRSSGSIGLPSQQARLQNPSGAVRAAGSGKQGNSSAGLPAKLRSNVANTLLPDATR